MFETFSFKITEIDGVPVKNELVTRLHSSGKIEIMEPGESPAWREVKKEEIVYTLDKIREYYGIK